MKKLLFLPMLVLTLTTCKKKDALSEPCATVTCQNGGTCKDGTCICPNGYYGVNCEKVSTSFIVGTYNCSLSGSYVKTSNGSGGNPCNNVRNFSFNNTF